MSCVHRIVTRETYTGVHHYNCTDSRLNRQRPKEEWVAISVPPIIEADVFARVKALLHQRRPTETPTRITNSEVLLTGIVRCESCGRPLMIRTGKSGRYRYYACSEYRLKGLTACGKPMAVPEHELDKLVLGALADRLMTGGRLIELLRQAQAHRRALTLGNVHRRAELRQRLKHSETRIGRMHAAIADGLVHDSELFRRDLKALLADRDECIRLLSLLETNLPHWRQALSKQQAASTAATLKRRLLDAPKPLQRRYVRGLVSDTRVNSAL